jgi:hypothetical protein
MQPVRLPVDANQFPQRANNDGSPKDSTHILHSSQASIREDGSPQLSAASTPSARESFPFSMLDLELLHFFTLNTALEMPHPWIWQVVLPQIAFDHCFLMHGLLAIAALHKAVVVPERTESLLNMSRIYQQRGLEAFQSILPSLNSENCHACFAFSMVIMITAWASPEHVSPFVASFNKDVNKRNVDLVTLQRGAVTVLSTASDIQSGPLRTMFEPWAEVVERSYPLPEEFREPFNQLDEHLKGALLMSFPEEVEAVEYAVAILGKMFTVGKIDSGINDTSATLGWPSLVSEKYIRMVNEWHPAALIVLAYYSILIKRIGDRWWIRGKAEVFLDTIKDILGERWVHCIQWPLAQISA